jgi:DNA-binding MarR family transcriptional regulator
MGLKNSITHSEYEALAGFRYALRQFLHFSEEKARSAGLTPQQYQAMLAIKGFPGTRPMMIGELAERLQVRHHSAVGLVGRLVSRGLVRREVPDADRRQVRLSLTARGEEMLCALSSAHKEQLRRFGPQLESLLKELRG